MNWFRFLKNKEGKIKIGLPQFIAVAGVGMVIATTAFQAEKEAVKQQQMRSLSSISSAYNYGGLQQTREGLTSVNVANLSGDLDRVATAEERARMEAQRTGGGDFGLDAADNVGGKISGFDGQAAQTSDTEGLGMSRNAVNMTENMASGGATGGPGVAAGAVAGAAGRGAGTQTPTNSLSSASMARASGNGINASYGGASSSPSSGSLGRMAASGMGRTETGEAYKFSGAMPSGTNPVSMGAGRHSGSSFMAGGRNSRGGKGGPGNYGNDLKDISKRSADVARNSFRASNEGSSAFLAKNIQTHGMEFTTGDAPTVTKSSDASWEDTPMEALQPAMQQTTDKENERAKHQGILLALMLGMLGISVWMWGLIKAAREAGKIPIYGQIAGNTIALVLAIALSVLWLGIAGYALWYNNEFFKDAGDTSTVSIAAWALSGIGIAVTWLVFALTSSVSEGTDKIVESFKSSVKGGLKTGVSTFGVPAAKTVAEETLVDSDNNKGKK